MFVLPLVGLLQAAVGGAPGRCVAVCHTLARWSQGHVSALEPFGERYGHDVDTGEVGRASAGLLAPLRERAGTVLGRHPQSGLLLRDIRNARIMNQKIGLTRNVIRRNYALITRDGCVASAIPGWTRCTPFVLISSALGAPLSRCGNRA